MNPSPSSGAPVPFGRPTQMMPDLSRDIRTSILSISAGSTGAPCVYALLLSLFAFSNAVYAG